MIRNEILCITKFLGMVYSSGDMLNHIIVAGVPLQGCIRLYYLGLIVWAVSVIGIVIWYLSGKW